MLNFRVQIIDNQDLLGEKNFLWYVLVCTPCTLNKYQLVCYYGSSVKPVKSQADMSAKIKVR